MNERQEDHVELARHGAKGVIPRLDHEAENGGRRLRTESSQEVREDLAARLLVVQEQRRNLERMIERS